MKSTVTLEADIEALTAQVERDREVAFGVVNAHRAEAGLPPVTFDAAWPRKWLEEVAIAARPMPDEAAVARFVSGIAVVVETEKGNGCCCMRADGVIETEDGVCCMSESVRAVFTAVEQAGGPSLVEIVRRVG